MLCRYFAKRQGFFTKIMKILTYLIKAMRNSGKKWMFQKKRSVLNSQYLTHRPPSSGLNGLENDCKENLFIQI